jgi:hypothetical protein
MRALRETLISCSFLLLFPLTFFLSPLGDGSLVPEIPESHHFTNVPLFLFKA